MRFRYARRIIMRFRYGFDADMQLGAPGPSL
jgi:hypothetical protein